MKSVNLKRKSLQLSYPLMHAAHQTFYDSAQYEFTF